MLEVHKLLLPRLRLSRAALVGKVLVHVDDEYCATPRFDDSGMLDAQNYCRLYAGFSRVFRPYWSQGWTRLAGGARGEMRGCQMPCGLPPPRVELTLSHCY